MIGPTKMIRHFLDGPLARPAIMRAKRRHFLSSEGHAAYFGVFDSFHAARAWLPASPEFNHAALAKDYVEVRAKRVFGYDYPVMWWLEKAFRSGATRVLDIGGSVGVHYYAYQHYLAMPPNIQWQIAEVPAMVRIGREMAAERGASALSFTENLQEALSGADIWIAAGSIQYFEDGRPSLLLKRCTQRPNHILLNKLPLYDGEDFVTTQNIDAGAFAPLHVWNRAQFIRDIVECGYTLRDQWPVAERSLYLPGYRDRSLATYSGLYFVAAAGA